MSGARLILLMATSVLFVGPSSLHAQADFKGIHVRPPNPEIHRSAPGISTRRRTGAIDPKTKAREEVEQALESGNRSMDAQNYPEAWKQYNQAATLDPNEPRAHYGLGNAYSEKWVATAHSFVSLIGDAPDPPERLVEMRAAIAAYERAIKLKPNFAEAYLGLGNTYDALAEVDKAIEKYQQAIHLNPHFVNAYLKLGSIYSLAEKYPEAVNEFNQVVRLDPNNLEAYERLATIFWNQEKWGEAAENYEQVVRLQPGNEWAHYALARIFQREERHHEAIEQYRLAIQVAKPEYSDTLYYSYVGLAKSYYSGQRYEDAITQSKLAIARGELGGHSAEAHFVLGLSYLKLNNKSAAMEQYQKLREINSDYAAKLLAEIEK